MSERTEGYVIRWLDVTEGFFYQQSPTTGSPISPRIEDADVMTLGVASRFLRAGGIEYEGAEIVRVRRVQGEDRLTPLMTFERELFDAQYSISCNRDATSHEIFRRIPGESRWVEVEDA